MTKSNHKSALLKAVVIFAVLYLLPHLLFVEFECHDILTIAVSILGGVAAALVFNRLKIKAENYWLDVSVFVLVYSAILGVSAALFYAGIEQGTFMWQVFYYFPQMVAVAFMIPGAAAFWLVRRFKYPKCKWVSHGVAVE